MKKPITRKSLQLALNNLGDKLGENNVQNNLNIEEDSFLMGNSLASFSQNPVANGLQIASSLGNIGDELSTLEGNDLQKGLGVANAVFDVGRNLASGIGVANRNKYVDNYFREKRRDSLRGDYNPLPNNQSDINIATFKDGGEGKLPLEKAITNDYITGKEGGQVNAEVESGEYLKKPNGTIQEVVGNKHSQGGEKVNLPIRTQVLTDTTEVGKELAKKVGGIFGIKINKTDTFSEVVDKYSKKIGYNKLSEEQEELIEVLKNQQNEGVDKSTQQVNLQYIADNINNIEKEKESLNTDRDLLFKMLFEEQQSRKPKEEKTNDNLKYGGLSEEDFNSFIKENNISKEEGEQFIMSYKKGGEVPKYERGDIVKVEELSNVLNQISTDPDYDPDDIKSIAERFKPYFDKAGIDYNTEDLSSLISLGRLAGELQKYNIEKYPLLAKDYGLKVQPTRQGLQYLVDKGVIDPKELGIQIYKGKVVRGSYGNLTPEQQGNLQNIIQGLDEETATNFAKYNYNDGQAYYRNIDVLEVGFDSQEELDAYEQEHKSDKIGDYYRTDKDGVYLHNVVNVPEVETTIEKTVEKEEEETEEKDEGVGEDIEKFRYRPPNQAILPPGALEPHLKVKRRYGRVDPVKIGIESTLTESFKQQDFINEVPDNLPPAQRAAILASSLATTQGTINNAIRETDITNAVNQQRADLFNIGQADREEEARAQDALRYEATQLTAKAKTEQDFRNYFNFNRRRGLNDYQQERRLNLIDDMFDNFTIDENTGIVYDKNSGKEVWTPSKKD